MAASLSTALGKFLQAYIPRWREKFNVANKITFLGVVQANDIGLPDPDDLTDTTDDTSETYQSVGTGSNALEVSLYKAVKFKIKDRDLARSPLALPAMFIPKAMRQIRNAIETSVCALQKDLTGPNRIGALGGGLDKTLVSAALAVIQDLGIDGVPYLAMDGTGRHQLVSKDAVLEQTLAMAGVNALGTGEFGGLYGFAPAITGAIVKSNVAPEGIGRVGVGFVREWAAIAYGKLPTGAEITDGRNVQTIVDPASGIPIRLIQLANPSGTATNFVLDCLWGVATQDKSAAVAIEY
jgi:hypothetical protein